MKRIGYAYSEYYEQLCNKLPSNLNRSSFIHSLIKAYGLFDKFIIITPEKANFVSLCGIHDDRYLSYLLKDYKKKEDTSEEDYEDLECNLEEEISLFGLDYDCPIFPELPEYVEFLAGTSQKSARLLGNDVFDIAIHWDGGRHHAKRSKASGFCYVNDVVLSIMELRKYYKRIMYLDLDLHAGDGVESAFLHSKNVLTLSLHRYDPGFFPGTGSLDLIGKGKGKYYALNVPLKKGLTDENFSLLFEHIIQPAFIKFNPDAIVIQCGCDGLFEDTYKEWNLTSQAYVFCLQNILKWEKKLLILGGGGYKNTIVSRCYALLTSIILGVKIQNDIPEHLFFDHYTPDFELLLNKGHIENENTHDYIEYTINTLKLYINNIIL
ncbi:hypothetical protein T552_00924 [Pneumocystis carinii B80]|uniref:Histone deacetylase n=1 Tax=Pneumocystis carinii (strain B80) TaxID=1408658 RepID=A0A0W4ZMW2_PNEC8|nr:hypothetical protein T552_00924 [Pneumocystis carinii B80]KTW29717.1 hypothetical protein T552_00924 [Pneumocystis carinii B80]